MDLSGQVIWNNYYGLPNSLSDAFGKYGIAKMLVVEGNNLLVGGMSYEDEGTFGGSTVNSENKFLISLDKNTGYLNWKLKFDSSEDGMINDIFKDGNEYYITGYTYQNRNMSDNKDALIAKVTSSSLNMSDFQSPDFRKEGQDFSGNFYIDNMLRANSQSAITTSNGDLYWFVMANNNHHFWAGPNIVDGYILELSSTGGLISYEDVGELRAYDMWMTGIPTDDGGFAMVSSRHSPTYFDTGTLPTPGTLLGDGTSATISSCDPNCSALTNASSSFYEYISTCAYVRKYDSSFDLEWDKIWDSTDNAPRECFPGNLKQQECLYRIIQSSDDGGLLICGNTSDNFDDSYIVKLKNPCGMDDFFGQAEGTGLITDYNDGIYSITSNTTWTTPKKILGRVKVEPGYTLTIQNTTVEFVSGSNMPSGIDVDLDGELIVDNSTLTVADNCDEMWHGLFAWSNKNNHQYEQSGYRDQGYIRIKNSSLIEKAEEGVNNMNYPYDYNEGGGVIIATDSEFRNCRRSGQFLKYQNFNPSNPSTLRKDLSYFEKCDFTVNNSFPTDREPAARVTMWYTNGVDFLGCDFQNTKTETSTRDRSNGIYTNDAIFTVNAHCSTMWQVGDICSGTETPSTFEGFYRGIEVASSTSGNPFYVRNSEFGKNMVGILADASIDPSIKKNEFVTHDHPYQPDLNDQYYLRRTGVGFINQTTEYTLELNDFIGNDGVTDYGSSIAGSGPYNNVVRSNYYTKLHRANQSFGENKESGTFDGLDYYCNTNERNIRDFDVEIDNSFLTPDGISKYQGSSSLKAGNLFTQSGSSDPFRHFYINPSASGSYYYYGTGTAEEPIFYNTPFTKIAASLSANENCADDGRGGGGLGKSGDLEVNLANYRDLQLLRQGLMDGGDSNSLLNEFDLQMANPETSISDIFSAYAPYISETSVVSILQTGSLDYNEAYELIMANPVVFGDQFVNSILSDLYGDEILNSLTEQITLEMLENDERFQLELTIHLMGMELAEQNKEMVHNVYTDSSGYSYEDLLNSRMHLLNIPQYYSQAFNMARSGDYGGGIEMLNQAEQQFNLSARQIEELGAVSEYYTFMENLHSSGREINELNEDEISWMIDMANYESGGYASHWSQNALCFHYNICDEGNGSVVPAGIEIEDPYAFQEETVQELLDYGMMPNPANQSTQVFFANESDKIISNIRVLDINGREVYSATQNTDTQIATVPTQNLANGVYLCEIRSTNGTTELLKMIVQH
jgi:hypothetical protein